MNAAADQGAHALWLALALLLVVSGLMSRRLPARRPMGWAIAWIALFGGLYMAFQSFEPEIAAWQQARRGGEISVVNGTDAASSREVEIPMARDGHFWVNADVGGQQVRFLIDSGASVTAVSESTARQIGLRPDPMGRMMIVQTGNGPVTARRSVIEQLQIGTIRASNLPVIVSERFSNVNVLGMNFLSKLEGWRVSNGHMTLEGG